MSFPTPSLLTLLSLSFPLGSLFKRASIFCPRSGEFPSVSQLLSSHRSPRSGPTFHHEFSRYRARKVAKTCSKISFPSPPQRHMTLWQDRRPARFCTVRHARRIKLSSRKLAYYLPDRDNSPRSRETCLPSLLATTRPSLMRHGKTKLCRGSLRLPQPHLLFSRGRYGKNDAKRDIPGRRLGESNR